MKKLWIFLVIFCMMAGSLRISAENYWLEDSISSGDTRVIAIPQPEGEIDPDAVYFTKDFAFINPAFNTDNTESGVCFSKTVFNISS